MNLLYDHILQNQSETVELPYEFRLKTRYFANKTVDFVMTKIKHRLPSSSQGSMYPRTLSDAELEPKRKENIERAVRRAKQSVHFACRSIGADHMLTLTTRENIQCRDKFFEVFTRFVRLVRERQLFQHPIGFSLEKRKEKLNWQYVAVPELQDRGAYHMHIACVGRQDLNFLRFCWNVALGGNGSEKGESTLGNIDVQYHKKRFSGLTELHKTFSLVRYLTKYISKGFEQSGELGLNRYKVSRQIPKPIVHKQFLMACFANNQQGFFEAMQEVISIAEFQGVGLDFQLWNRGDDVFILRGYLND